MKLSYKSLKVYLQLIICVLSIVVAANRLNGQNINGSVKNQNEYGPENFLKTWHTPFTTTSTNEESANLSKANLLGLSPIAVISGGQMDARKLLEERFHGPKLFLPARMVLGQSSAFTVKGSPGSYVAVAMADSNNGAKEIYGRKLRLGSDRKLVAVGKIPETGVLTMFVEAPIQGDLIGLPLYFEAVVWNKSDFSDLQLASPVSAIEDSNSENGVIVCGQEEKKERAVVFDVKTPMSMQSVGLSSGRP